jgi:hypothetical protein
MASSMSRSRKGTWKTTAAAVALMLGALVACSSTSEEGEATPEASFCSALTDAYGKCSTGTVACGDAMRAECSKLAALLNPSILTAATGCLQSATCESDPLTCLGTSLGAAKPSEAQSKLATDFCTSCATVGGAPCETAFFGAGGAPGLGVALLPFGDAPLAAIGEACTENKLGKTACQAAFSSCVSATATKVLAESISTEAVKCLVTGIKDGLAGGGTGPTGGACTDCAGCCKDGTCVTGEEPTACGTGGSACESCAPGASCTGGKCVSACGPDSCGGCCDANGECQVGDASAACGARGGACTSCPGSTTCNEGACIDPSCKASCTAGCCSAQGCQPGTAGNACGTGGNACANCGVGRSCSAGKCGLSDASAWDFVLVGAHLPAKNADNAAWDAFSGLPDAFGSVTSGATTGSVPSVADTLDPVWNATALANVTAGSLKAQLRVELWDEDAAFDDHVGVCTIALTGPEFDGALHTAVCPAAAGDVAFRLDYRLKAR